MYVWSSYAAAAVLLVGLLVASWRGLRRQEAELEAADEGGRRRRQRT
jgi:heme exporter protein CcmD